MFLNKFKLQILFTLIISFTIILAHGKHKNKIQKQDTLTIVGKDTIAINGVPTKTALLLRKQKADEHELNEEKEHDEADKEVTFAKLFEHLHNKIIHFPIALSVGAFLLILFGYREEKMIKAVKILIPFATLMAIIAVFTGLNQSGVFEGTATYKFVEVHRILGISTTLFFVFWSVSLFVGKLKKFTIILAVITLLLVLITAFYGGIIAH